MAGLGEKWRALTDEEKQVYNARAAEEKTTQDALITEYHLENPNCALASTSSKGSKKTKAASQSSSKKSSKKAKLSLRQSDGSDAMDEDDEMGGEKDEDEEEDDGDHGNERSHLKRSARPTSLTDEHKDENDDDDDDDDDDGSKTPSSAVAKATPKKKPSVKISSSKKRCLVEPSGSASRGIKQDELATEDDLLHTKWKPLTVSAFPPDDTVAKEKEVVVILAPYRAFVSTQQHLLGNHERNLVQQICVIKEEYVVATVKNVQNVQQQSSNTSSSSSSSSSSPPSDDDSLKFVTVSTKQGRVFTILHVPYTSPLLTGDRFVISKALFDTSLKSRVLQIGSPIRRAFAVEQECDEGAGLRAEWLEGIVYHTKPGLASSPYNSVLVIWVQQEQETNHWLYRYDQTCNECSPWDLEPSHFTKHCHQYKPVSLPKSMTGVGNLSAFTILDFLSIQNGANLFSESVAEQSAEFRAMFPDHKTHLDLRLLKRQAAMGRYEGTSFAKALCACQPVNFLLSAIVSSSFLH